MTNYTSTRDAGFTSAHNDTKLDLCYKEDEPEIHLSKQLYLPDDPKYPALVKKIADAFDTELLAGKYQEHFGKIISESKHIRGL